MRKNKLLLLLALLMTAATGAWAQDETYPIVYDFEAAANAGENPDNKNGAGGTGQGFFGWESESKKDWPRQDYKGYEYVTGSVLPKVCHVWRRSDRINGNVSNGGLQCPSDKQMAVDGLTEGLTVTIIYDATNASSKEIVWAIGDGSSELLTQPRATATINGVEAVPGQTTIKSGDVITVNSVTAAQNGTGYIVFKVMKDMVIKKIIIDEAKAASGYTVSMKDGVKDADKWTVKVGEGEAQALPIGGLKGDGSETVTLQYNGRLKVKGVKATSDAAPAAKPAATVTTAPTATTGDIAAGSETALVSGGAADGGTMMYAVTTTNTQPSSTEGFSDAVPTAKTLAAGTYYVWYYVKGDDSHTDSEIAGPVSVTLAAMTIVNWDKTNVFVQANEDVIFDNWDKGPFTFEGVSISFTGSGANSNFYLYGGNAEAKLNVFESTGGQYTFTAPSGKQFTKIEITDNSDADCDEYGDWKLDGTTKFVWSGTPSNTVTLGRGSGYSNRYIFNNLKSIVFTLVDAE